MRAPDTVMLLTMLKLQDSMNAKINPDWRNAGYDFLRAVLVESVEAMEHHGWKWWKKQAPDMPQLRIELIDIWHFVLSHFLVQNGGDRTAAAQAIAADLDHGKDAVVQFDGHAHRIDALTLLDKLQLLAGLASARRTSIPLIASLFEACDLKPSDLYRAYLSKNVLNHFRQDRGYKTGEYKKWWDNREDNEHLDEILQTLDFASETLPETLYARLSERYDELLRAGKMRADA